MQLVTIADLDRPHAEKSALIERAMQLSRMYEEFKATDTQTHKYDVEIHGERSRAPGIHASEMSKCQRMVVYSIRDVERRSVSADQGDTNMRMRFALGHAVHAMIQSDMHRMAARYGDALQFEDEVKIHPGLGGVAATYDMHSSCDGLFTFKHNGVPYLRVGLEIKTSSGPEFDKLVKPAEEYSEQTCLYQKALDVPLMWIFYYNKSNSNWTKSEPPWLYQFDKHLWDTKLEPRFIEAHRNAASGHYPERSEGRHCRWCPFAWTCQPNALNQRQYGPSTTARRPGALRVHR